MNKHNVTIFALILTGTMACTTGKKHSNDESLLSASGKDAITVQQGSNGKIVMSPNSQSQWVTLRKNSKSEDVKLFSGLAAGQGAVAEKEARAYLLKNPGSFSGLYVLAASLYMQKRYDLSGFYAQELQRLYPDSAEALNLRALSISLSTTDIGNHQLALKLFDEAASKSSDEIAALLNKGHLLLELGNTGTAQETFTQAKIRCHGCAEANLGLAIAESRLGQFDKSKANLEQILKSDPDHPEALYHLALIHKNGFNDIKGAKKTLNKLVAKQSSSYRDIKERGSSLLHNLNATTKVNIDQRNQEIEKQGEYLMPASHHADEE
jgi:tetratricopeptide (TPR) repeat protein